MPDGSIQIGPADRSEIGSLARLLGELGYQAQEKRLAEALDQAAENPSFEVIAARRAGVVVGLMSLIRFDYFPTGERICRITALVVDRACRSAGIGTRLIDHARDRAKATGCVGLEITTSLHRTETHSYYERLGFSKTSFRYFQALPQDDHA